MTFRDRAEKTCSVEVPQIYKHLNCQIAVSSFQKLLITCQWLWERGREGRLGESGQGLPLQGKYSMSLWLARRANTPTPGSGFHAPSPNPANGNLQMARLLNWKRYNLLLHALFSAMATLSSSFSVKFGGFFCTSREETSNRPLWLSGVFSGWSACLVRIQCDCAQAVLFPPDGRHGERRQCRYLSIG